MLTIAELKCYSGWLKMVNWWIWERPATIHLIYTTALAAEHELKKVQGEGYASYLYGFFQRGMVRWMCDFDNLIKNGIMVTKTFLNSEVRKSKDEEWKRRTERLIHEFKEIDSMLLQDFSDEELLQLYTHFDQAYLEWWGFGQVAELISYGGEEMLKLALTPAQQKEYFNLLVTPTKKSYTTLQEEALFAIVKMAQERGLKDQGVKKKIQEHSQRYHWVQNNYYDTIRLDEKYFMSAIEKLIKAKIDVNELQRQNEQRLTELREKKKGILKTLKLADNLEKVVWLLDDFCYFQDYRKAINMQADGYLDILCKEVARRKKIKYSLLRSATPDQMKAVLKGELSSIDIIKKQGEHCVIIFNDQNNLPEIYTGLEAAKKERELLGKEVHFQQITEFEGSCANNGRVSGVVRKLLSPRDIEEMQEGEILVSTMTTPDFVPAMKKAAAIITDEGGITCHAAIVSRELGIPCVIGTKIATKVLNSGDVVEVKANHGLIYIKMRKK